MRYTTHAPMKTAFPKVSVVHQSRIKMNQLRAMLKTSLPLLLLVQLISANAENFINQDHCSQKTNRVKNVTILYCVNLKSLQKPLDKASANLTRIIIKDSKIPNVHGHAFVRFSATLETLDMHSCGIEAMDQQALVNLVNLKELILWGNKLAWISSSWFVHLENLRLLDLSFNMIQDIDHLVYQMLPNLEYFYIDYNRLKTVPFTLFSYFGRLKKVKFGMNNWNWAFRVHLTWQLIYQKVDFQDDWENWTWMSDAVRDCVESGQVSIPKDEVLDCVTLKLLNTARENFADSNNITLLDSPCSNEISSLVHCSSKKKLPNAESVRKALQGFNSIVKQMSYSRGKFDTL